MTAAISRRRFHIDRGLLVASLTIAAGLALIGWGLVVSSTGDERDPLPAAIESVEPAPQAKQVPQQAGLVIDLAAGHEAALFIDDVEVPVQRLDEVASLDAKPGQQLDLPPGAVYEPGNATITFTPNDDAVVTTLEPGPHRVRVTYWKVEDGPAVSTSYTWEFDVI
ncbi:MAG: hypothetical protein WKF45_08920 [Ilumatobacteraceae bacterium]